MRKILSCLFALTLSTGAFAQAVTIGSGTNTSSYPYYTYYHDSRVDFLITAAELTAAGATAGNITQIGFNVVTAYTQVMNGFNIKMQHTAATTVTGFISAGWTTVYSGTYSVPATGWQMIMLTTPFTWDGTSNILFEICFDNTSYTSASTVYASTAANMTWGRAIDASTGCTLTGGAAQTYRPNTRLYFGTPAGCIHTISLTDTYGDGWNGGNVTVTVNGSPELSNITLASGSGPVNYTFYASTGDVINVTRTADGSFPSEMRIQVSGVSGTIIPLQQPPLAPGVNGTGDCGSPMAFVSSTCTQNNTAGVGVGAQNAEIIGIQIVTSGSGSPFNATQFQMNMTGTTNLADVTSIDIYYTGTSSVFSTATLFGSVTPGAGTRNVNGSQVLQNGTNYFWLVYDISGSATVGNLVDARCTQITMSGAGGTRVPSVTSPTGTRTITAACVHTLRLTDTYGDGWSGGAVTVSVDGAPVISNVSLPSGAGPADTTFLAASGSTINVTRTIDGSFPSEMRAEVLGPVSTVIALHQPVIAPGTNGAAYCGTPMTYVSTTCTQNNTSKVAIGTNNAEVIGIQIVTSGELTPLSLTQVQFNMTGTTNLADITNVDVYYTGNNPVCGTTTLFGTTTPAGGTIIMNGSQTLAPGTNYFWIVYDIYSSATIGNLIDARCTQVTISGGVGNQIPAVTNPAGTRTIYEPCTHYIILTDTYGDGWNSGEVTVNVNGSPVLSGITLASGAGPVSIPFWAGTADAINVIRTADGSFPSEMRIEVTGPFGGSIIALQQPLAAPGINGTGACICPLPVSCATYLDPLSGASDVMPSGVNLSWQPSPEALSYKLSFGTNNPPSNIVNGANIGNVSTYNTGGLNVNTTYYWKIVPLNCSGEASGCSVWSFTTINETRWTGLVSTQWTNPGNWSAGVPTQFSDAVIPFKTGNPGQYRPTLNDNSAVCRHIILEKGGILNASDKLLTVHGKWKNCYGSFNPGTGTVTFTGVNDATVGGYDHPAFVVSSNTGPTATIQEHESDGSNIFSGDDRGLIIVNRDYVYVTGDQRTVRMDINLSGANPVNLAHRRDGMFVDLLSGKIYSLYHAPTSTVPVWPLVDDQYPEYTFTCDAIIELDPLTLDTVPGSCIRLTNTAGALTSFICKGGQTFSTIWRTGLFSGYGFLGIFADRDSPLENMYVIDLPTGILYDFGHKNITPDVVQSDSWAFSGISEFDGTDYFVIYRNEITGDLMRINMSTLTETTLMSFSDLGDCANVAYSPWYNRWYFHWEGLSQYGGVAGREYVGFVSGSHNIFDPEKEVEVFNHFTVNKNAGKIVELQVPISANNINLLSGILDVSAENNSIQLRGNWTNTSSASAFVPRQGEVKVEGGTGPQYIKGSMSTTFYNLTKNSIQTLSVADPAANVAEVIVSNNFNWVDNNDTLWVGNPAYSAIFDIPGIYVDNDCALKMTSLGTLEVKRNFALTNNCTFQHGNGLVICDGNLISRIQRIGNISIWSDNCNSLTGWTNSGWQVVDPDPAHSPDGPSDDYNTGGSCFITNGTSTYANSTTYSLTSPAIDLSSLTGTIELGFRMWMNTEGSTSFWDGGNMQISNNNGSSWTAITNAELNILYDGIINNTYSNPLGGQSGWSFDRTTWTHVIVSIPAGYNTSTFRFRLTFGSDSYSQTGTGWAVDGFEITGIGMSTGLPVIFGNLEVKKTASSTVLMNDIGTDNNLTITSGGLSAGSAKTIKVKGHWMNNGGTFLHNSDSVFFTGTANSNIRTNNSPFYRLIISNPAGVTLVSHNAQVDQELIFTSGRINTGTNWVYVENDQATSVNGHADTRYINGNLRRKVLTGIEYDLPVGTSSWYEIAKIRMNAAAGLTHINTFFTPFSGVFGTIEPGLTLNGSPVTTLLDYGFWTIYPNIGGTSGDYDITLTSRGHTNGGTAADQHTCVKRNDAIDTWKCFGNHDNATQIGTGTNPITAVRTNIAGFSDHAIARNDVPLPVEMLSFEAECRTGGRLLTWVTGSEQNSSHFVIEKSNNGVDWLWAGNQQAAGNSVQNRLYTFFDAGSENDELYYRLRQFDLDGASVMYGPVSVLCGQQGLQSEPSVWPNPFGDYMMISFGEQPAEGYTWILRDVTGRLLADGMIQSGDVSNGSYRLQLPDLPAGLYTLELTDPVQTSIFKLHHQ